MNEKRRRAYREQVLYSLCKKKINSDYKNDHASTKHSGESPSFFVALVEGQSTLNFSKRARIEGPSATSASSAPSISSSGLHNNDSANDRIDFYMNSSNINVGEKTTFDLEQSDHIDNTTNDEFLSQHIVSSIVSSPSTPKSVHDHDEVENSRTVQLEQNTTTNDELLSPHISSSIIPLLQGLFIAKARKTSQ